MKTNRIAVLVCILACSFAAAQAPKPAYPFNDPTQPAEKRIDNLLSLMTIDEKIDCLGTITAVPRLGVMSFGNSEGIHGVVQRETRGNRQPITTTQFPQPPGMGASWIRTWCARPRALRATRRDSSRRRPNTTARS